MNMLLPSDPTKLRETAPLDPPAASAPAGPELTEADLEHVVGGLARAWIDGSVVPDDGGFVRTDARQSV
jgi:hypothetical protein